MKLLKVKIELSFDERMEMYAETLQAVGASDDAWEKLIKDYIDYHDNPNHDSTDIAVYTL